MPKDTTLIGAFALISCELLPMAMLTPTAAYLGVTEGASRQAEALTALFPSIAAPMVAPVIPAQSEPLRSGYRWRQDTGPVLAGRLRPPRTAMFFEAEEVLLLKGYEPPTH
ncbi:hypothetical protein GGE43_005291 [Agrobacterium tumefaciens]|uniref:Uncharacterized protein n=1 Tax=Agrobacterium radiobacter TaxID=362 RepID=A0ABR6JET0_AGRRD|nr:MFS transporter [Agrobacterium radiobacter]MBB4325530.1 hypothetical protein [Agrobacterium radiobacter]MBB4338559.1 hypothetical protein [Agrobacterium radiobacter]MBB4493447.1 hypothetical protein [Agrobacterium radiobacter]MBB4498718.1 hypothetical protein [Agrobacterium radiobacter]MBB4504034.1 hypothetical protein [Agrobacterium radiobacter]